MRYYTNASQMAADLEKYMGSPYTINVVEELARNKMIAMVHEKREEDRKRRFEETVQVCIYVCMSVLMSSSLFSKLLFCFFAILLFCYILFPNAAAPEPRTSFAYLPTRCAFSYLTLSYVQYKGIYFFSEAAMTMTIDDAPRLRGRFVTFLSFPPFLECEGSSVSESRRHLSPT